MNNMRFVLLMCMGANARAYTTGIAGYSGKDGMTCTECHAPGAAAKPSAMINGPAALAPGQSADYQLVIDTDVTSSASAKRAAGIDIAASGGALATVDQVNQTRVLMINGSAEISHTNALPQAKTVAISFSLTAPAEDGVVTLFAAALSADGDGSNHNDSTVTTSLDVIIGTPDLAGVDAISGASKRDEPMTGNSGPPKNEARWSCGSYVGAVPISLAPIALVLPLVIALRTARRGSRGSAPKRP
jgi:hypothetical protein